MVPRKKQPVRATIDDEFDDDEGTEDTRGVPWATQDFPSNADVDSMFDDDEIMHEVGCEMGDDCQCAD